MNSFELSSEKVALLSRVYSITYRHGKTWGRSWLEATMHLNSIPENDLEVWKTHSERSHIDVYRGLSLVRALQKVASIDGDLAEFGSARGGTAAFLAKLCERYDLRKKVILIDTFAGLPDPNPRIDRAYRKGQFKCSREAVESFLQKKQVLDRCYIIEGDFEDARSGIQDKSICLAHIDGDLYSSTWKALDIMREKAGQGAILVLDDFWDDSGGARLATIAFLKHGGTVWLGPSGQALVSADALLAPETKAARLKCSTKWLRNLSGYKEFLIECVSRSAKPDRELLMNFLALVD